MANDGCRKLFGAHSKKISDIPLLTINAMAGVTDADFVALVGTTNGAPGAPNMGIAYRLENEMREESCEAALPPGVTVANADTAWADIKKKCRFSCATCCLDTEYQCVDLPQNQRKIFCSLRQNTSRTTIAYLYFREVLG